MKRARAWVTNACTWIREDSKKKSSPKWLRFILLCMVLLNYIVGFIALAYSVAMLRENFFAVETWVAILTIASVLAATCIFGVYTFGNSATVDGRWIPVIFSLILAVIAITPNVPRPWVNFAAIVNIVLIWGSFPVWSNRRPG